MSAGLLDMERKTKPWTSSFFFRSYPVSFLSVIGRVLYRLAKNAFSRQTYGTFSQVKRVGNGFHIYSSEQY